jgi:hypothetical protein
LPAAYRARTAARRGSRAKAACWRGRRMTWLMQPLFENTFRRNGEAANITRARLSMQALF